MNFLIRLRLCYPTYRLLSHPSISSLLGLLKPSATVRVHYDGMIFLNPNCKLNPPFFLLLGGGTRSVGGGVADLSAQCVCEIVIVATQRR